MSDLRLTLLLLTPLLACGGAGDSDTGASSDTGSTAATSNEPGTTGTTGTASTTTATSDEPTAASEPPTSSASEDSTAGPGDTTTGDDSTTSDTGTTGEPAFCNGWQSHEGEPYLNLFDLNMAPLEDGAVLPLECGGQGLFMFGLYAQFGGFTPPGEYLDFAVTVDVDGFNTNPEGHFYSADPVGYYVGCEPLDGGVFGVLPVFPLDNLDDLTALDGKPAQITVSMPAGDIGYTLILEVVLSVKKDDSWAFCGG